MKLKNSHFCRLLLVFFIITISGVQDVRGEQKSSAKKNERFLVGFAQDTMGNDWRIAQVRELEKALAHDKSIKFMHTNAEGQTAKQIADIENLVEQGVDVLVTSPRDGRAMDPVISKAYKKGIPVVLLSRRIPSDNFTTFIAPDNSKIGSQAAQRLAQVLKQKGNAIVLQGIPTASTAIARTEGFMKEIAQFPDINITATLPANYLRGDAIKVIEDTLIKGVKFDAIYAQSDSMASGARMALKQAGLDLKKIMIIGIDYIPEAREAIRTGEQDSSFTYPTCGKEGGDMVIRILQGQPVQKEITIDSIMVTKDNVAEVETIF